jgi:hypothetical protein
VCDNEPRPRWWVLYSVLPLTTGLFVLEIRTPESPSWHTLAELGIVLFTFVYVWLWLSANSLALIQQDWGEPSCDQRRYPVQPAATARVRLESGEASSAFATLSRNLKPPISLAPLHLLQTIRGWLL